MSAGSGEKETNAKAETARSEAGQDKETVQDKTAAQDKAEKKDSTGDADKKSGAGGEEKKAEEPVTITVSAAGDHCEF